jgi:O-antigen ligase
VVTAGATAQTTQTVREVPVPELGTRVVARALPRRIGRSRRTRLAPLTIAAGVAVLPLLRPVGLGNSAPADVVILLAIGVTLLTVISTRAVVHLPYVVPVGLLMLAGALGALLHEQTGAAVLALGQDLLLFLFVAAIVNACRTPREVGAVLRTWAISATAWAALMVVAVATGNDGLAGISARTGSRAALTFGDANLAASYFVISILVVAAARTPRRRPVRVLAYLLLTAAVLLTGSLGGALSLGIALALLAVRAVGRRFGGMAAVAIVLLLAVPVAVGVRAGYDALTSAARDPSSPLHDSLGRVSASTAGHDRILAEDVQLLQNASVFGEGPTSTKGALAREQVIYVKEAHNDYLATAVERGALGVLALVVLVGALAMRSRRALARSAEPAIARAVPLVFALVAALAAVACSAMFYEVLHFRHVWALFGVVAAVALARDP